MTYSKTQKSSKNKDSRTFLVPKVTSVDPNVYMAQVRAMPHPKTKLITGIKQTKGNKTIAALNRKTAWDRKAFLSLMLSAMIHNEEHKRKRGRDRSKDSEE